jgi:NADP-reducing hydrogenase subunit HndD
MGESTGAAVIFGATGGVMEAALRTAVWKLTGQTNDSPIEFKEVRGMEGIKEATYKVNDLEVKVAIASGLANAKVIMDKIRAGEADYTFVEIMACPGGCINGGGQPQVPAHIRNFVDYRSLRAGALYKYDETMPVRKSHENKSVLKLYEEFFGEPNSHKAHEVLHTTYVKRKVHEI